jgi:hypothetical protein
VPTRTVGSGAEQLKRHKAAASAQKKKGCVGLSTQPFKIQTAEGWNGDGSSGANNASKIECSLLDGRRSAQTFAAVCLIPEAELSNAQD